MNPKIYIFPLNIPQNYFWCNIFRCSKHLLIRELTSLLVNVSFIQIGGQRHQSHLTQTEVSQLDVSQGSDQQVIRFKIPMYNAVAGMQKTNIVLPLILYKRQKHDLFLSFYSTTCKDNLK